MGFLFHLTLTSRFSTQSQNQYSNSPEWGSWFYVLHPIKNHELDQLAELWTRTRLNKNLRSCYGYQIFLKFSYFLFSLITDKENQRDTYLNPCSKFILNFRDIIYSQRLHFVNDRSYLNSNLCLSNYALFSNHDRGYADLSKRLWLCVSKHVGIFNHLFLYRFLLKYYYKYIKL